MPKYLITYRDKVLVSWSNRKAKWAESGATIYPSRPAAMAVVRAMRLAQHPAPIRAYRARRSDADPNIDDHGWLG